MSTAVITTTQEILPGSSTNEFKEFIGKSTYHGFAYTLSVLAFLFLINFSLSFFKDEKILPIKMREIRIICGISFPPQENNARLPPPSPKRVVSGLASVAGNPIPETPLTQNAKEFANTDDVSIATARVGNDIDNDRVGSSLQTVTDDVPPTTNEVDDGEREDDLITFAEQMPNIDLYDIQKRVVYPEFARRQNAQGTVYVGILVGKNGKPLRSKIVSSENSLLNSAAEKACMEATYTPGIQNGQPIDVWVTVPVKFSLR
jgi:TonB family protein